LKDRLVDQIATQQKKCKTKDNFFKYIQDFLEAVPEDGETLNCESL
jgi:hypothetical protein